MVPILDSKFDKENASAEAGEDECSVNALPKVQQKWGEDMYCPMPPPVFKIKLVIECESLVFFPSLEQVENGIISCFDALMHRTSNIHDVAAKVRVEAHSAMKLSRLCTLMGMGKLYWYKIVGTEHCMDSCEC